MTCYRKGGCGPYEMLSCGDCPASKPEYAERYRNPNVVEARYGKWIPDKKDVEWGNSLIHYRCSECSKRPHFDKEKYRFILSPYCPNCGADMSGVIE